MFRMAHRTTHPRSKRPCLMRDMEMHLKYWRLSNQRRDWPGRLRAYCAETRYDIRPKLSNVAVDMFTQTVQPAYTSHSPRRGSTIVLREYTKTRHWHSLEKQIQGREDTSKEAGSKTSRRGCSCFDIITSIVNAQQHQSASLEQPFLP